MGFIDWLNKKKTLTVNGINRNVVKPIGNFANNEINTFNTVRKNVPSAIHNEIKQLPTQLNTAKNFTVNAGRQIVTNPKPFLKQTGVGVLQATGDMANVVNRFADNNVVKKINKYGSFIPNNVSSIVDVPRTINTISKVTKPTTKLINKVVQNNPANTESEKAGRFIGQNLPYAAIPEVKVPAAIATAKPIARLAGSSLLRGAEGAGINAATKYGQGEAVSNIYKEIPKDIAIGAAINVATSPKLTLSATKEVASPLTNEFKEIGARKLINAPVRKYDTTYTSNRTPVNTLRNDLEYLEVPNSQVKSVVTGKTTVNNYKNPVPEGTTGIYRNTKTGKIESIQPNGPEMTNHIKSWSYKNGFIKLPSGKYTTDKIPDELFNNEKGAQVYGELSNATAGSRFSNEVNNQGGTQEWSGKESTFPQWVPKDLRKKELFNKVQDHLINGTVPTNKREADLYDVIHNHLLEQNGMPGISLGDNTPQSLSATPNGKIKLTEDGKVPVSRTSRESTIKPTESLESNIEPSSNLDSFYISNKSEQISPQKISSKEVAQKNTPEVRPPQPNQLFQEHGQSFDNKVPLNNNGKMPVKKSSPITSVEHTSLVESSQQNRKSPIESIKQNLSTKVSEPQIEDTLRTQRTNPGQLINNQETSSFDNNIPLLPEKSNVPMLQSGVYDVKGAKKQFKLTGEAPEFNNTLKPNEKPIPVIYGDFATRTTEGGKIKPIGNYNAGIFVPKDIQEAVTKGKDRSVIGMLRESPIRNVEDVFGEGGDKINDYLVRPVAENETKRTNWLNSEIEQVRQNIFSKLGKKNSLDDQLAFDYAEKNISLDELKTQTPNWKQVSEAAELGRAKYKEWLGQINATLTKYGYEPIKPLDNYVTHIQKIDGFFNQFGSLLNMDKDKLPTVMAGIHTTTRPGKKWFAFAQPRKGGEYDKSLIGAIDAYLPKASEQIFHTDSIQRARLLQKTIEGSVTDVADKTLSNFSSWLGQYADKLSGKTSILDRGTEKTLGRGVLKASSWAKSRVGANMVGANISASLTNFIPLTQSLATTNKPAALRGLMEAVTAPFTKPGTVDGVESGFLRRRFADNRVYITTTDKAVDNANILFKTIDRFTSESVVRGKYYEALKQGMSKSQAMKVADEYAGRVITDRSFGQLPVLFDSKTLGLFTQFQAEVNNQLSFIFKDIPKMAGGNNLKLASMLTQVAVYSYLYNQLSEQITGRRPAFDPIGVIQDGYEDYSSGNKKATKNLVENIAGQLPFISTFTGGGRIPLSAAFPDVMGIINGTTNWKKEALKPVTYILPKTGGGQIKKSYEGIKAFKQGASTTDTGKVRYPIEKNAINKVKTSLFGQYSTPEATKYFKNGDQSLSKDQSEMFFNLGGDTKAYETVKDIYQKEKDKTKRNEQLRDEYLEGNDSVLNQVSSDKRKSFISNAKEYAIVQNLSALEKKIYNMSADEKLQLAQSNPEMTDTIQKMATLKDSLSTKKTTLPKLKISKSKKSAKTKKIKVTKIKSLKAPKIAKVKIKVPKVAKVKKYKIKKGVV